MSASNGYTERAWALFLAAPRAGAPGRDGHWSTGEAREPLSRTWVRAHVRTEAGRIVDVRYEVRGCPYTVAAAALLAERWVDRGATTPPLAARALLAELGAPVSKLGRLLVVDEAFQKALHGVSQSA